MKQNLLNKLWLRVGMIVAIMTTTLAGSAWAEEESVTFSSQGYSNQQEITSYVGTNFSIAFDKGTNTNPPKYFTNGTAIRCYGSNFFTVNSPYTITKIEITFGSGDGSNEITTDVETYSNGTWTGSAKSVKFTIGGTTGNRRISGVKVTYTTGGATAPSISAGNLSIAYNATEGEIEYAVSNPVTGGTLSASTTSDWLVLGEVDDDLVPFECEANDGVERTATITLTYTYGTESVTANVTVTQAANPNGPGTEALPYTVAQARAAIDAGTGTQGVYATGIVSAIPAAYNASYKNITFNFVDAAGDTDFLQAYRCAGALAEEVQVGDVVVVYGNLTKYNTTYEFAANCELVSLTHPTVAVEAPTFSPVAGTYTEAQSVTLSCETSGATIYYTTDGTEPTTESTQYTAAITVSTTTTIKAIAVKGSDVSTVASATYHFCSADAPYTVAQALAFAEYPANGVYVHGIVSTAPTMTPTSNGELTYYISDDGAATNQLEVYKGKGLEQAAFTAQDDLQVGDIVTVYGNVVIYGTSNPVKEFATGNYLVSFERPVGPVADPVIVAENATIPADVTYYELMYNIENPVEGTALTATTDATWIRSVTPSEKSFDRVMIECTANESAEARTATIVLTYGTATKEVTLTQEGAVAPVEDYVTLPYSWAGGTKDALLAETGVTASGLGSDYAESNAPYRVKFDTTGDYIQFKTDSRPGVVTIEVKMLGGANTSTITVQESADGETFLDVQELTISGAQNDVLTLSTTTEFAETSRYVRLYFTKGSNVGVGPISIAAYAPIVLSDYTLTVLNPDNVTITATYGTDGILTNAEEGEVTEGTEVTLALTVAEGYDLENVTVNGTDDGQAVNLAPGTTETVFTFTMPAFGVTVNATAVEHVEVVTSDYVLATSITSGKSYVIASGVGGTVQVMAEQKNNNRGAVEATISNGVLKVSEEYEFVIETANIGEASGYSIFDPDAKGYLYAAASDKNYLKTQTDLNDNGIWAITFDPTDASFSVVAQGANSRNVMQYNSGSTLFSCYATASQSPVYLFEKVGDAPTVQTLTVTAARYATMVTEANLEIPADVEVFAIQTHDSYATLLPVTGNIPAGEAVLVKADAGEYSFAYTQEADAITVNELVGATEDVVADGTQYILANGGEGIGFYKATTGSTIKAGKAYLVVPAGIKGFYGFDEDDATGISDLNANVNANEAIYNLAGQRIQKMQRGINIVGGKKVLK